MLNMDCAEIMMLLFRNAFCNYSVFPPNNLINNNIVKIDFYLKILFKK